jgi:hypothetical protein
MPLIVICNYVLSFLQLIIIFFNLSLFFDYGVISLQQLDSPSFNID